MRLLSAYLKSCPGLSLTKIILALLPILKWKSYFEGSTGYIDQINPKNVSYPIMIGIDDYKRPYITIKTQSTFKKNIYSVVVTIFQRYSDSKSVRIQFVL